MRNKRLYILAYQAVQDKVILDLLRKEKIEEMVNNIIKDKLNSGQLDECDLTLKDLGKIRVCFLTALNGIYHQRIEYPTEKKKIK